MKLTAKERREMVKDYVMMGSYRDVANKYGVSHVTVRNVVAAHKELYDKLTLYEQEKVEDLQKFIDDKKDTVAGLIDIFLFELANPEKLASASLSQVAQATGVLIEKFVRQKGSLNLENTGVVVLPQQAEVIYRETEDE